MDLGLLAGAALSKHSNQLQSVYSAGIPLVPTSTPDAKINKNLKFHQGVDELVKEMHGQGQQDGLVNSWLNTRHQHERRLANYERLIKVAPERVRSDPVHSITSLEDEK